MQSMHKPSKYCNVLIRASATCASQFVLHKEQLPCFSMVNGSRRERISATDDLEKVFSRG